MVATEWDEGGMTRWNMEDFQGSETTLCETAVVDPCRSCVQTYRMHSTKCDRNVHYGHWIMTCPYRFTG